MVGFIKGFFGAKDSSKKTSQSPRVIPQNSQNSEAFFLEADQSSSLGNIDYMQTVKSIRRTFPKTLDNAKGMEFTVEVSSKLKRQAGLNNPLSEPANDSQPITPKVDEVAERRRTDTSMDRFRSMARDMKKR